MWWSPHGGESPLQNVQAILWSGPTGKVFELEARCLQDFFSFPHIVVAAEVPEEDLCPLPHLKRLRNEGPRAKNENMWRAQLARGAEF